MLINPRGGPIGTVLMPIVLNPIKLSHETYHYLSNTGTSGFLFAQHIDHMKDGEMHKGELIQVNRETITFFYEDRSQDFLKKQVKTISFLRPES